MKKFEFGKVHCVDCLKAMKSLPDKSIDAIVTDPPYGIGTARMKKIGYTGFNIYKRKNWDDHPPTKEYFTEMIRISKQQIIWGGNYFQLPPSRGWLVWNKGAGFKGRTFSEAELAWTSLNTNVKVFTHDPLAHHDYRGKLHPCQKPVQLMEWCLEMIEGDLVLDPFAGSGSTCVACLRMKKSFLGFEIDPEYCEIANERILAAQTGKTYKQLKAGLKTLFEITGEE